MNEADLEARGGDDAISSNGEHGAAEKAVVLLFALERAKSARIIQKLTDNENNQIVRVAARMGRVDAARVAAALLEFKERCYSDAGLQGGADEAFALLTQALPPERRPAMSPGGAGLSGEAIWDLIQRLPPARVASYLRNETAGICAYVFSKISASAASRILLEIEPESRIAIVEDLLLPVKENRGINQAIEQALVEEFLTSESERSRDDRIAEFSDILNAMDSEEISEMMRVIAAHDPTLAEALKRHVFTFDDLSQLQAQTLSRIFDRLPPDRTVVALHGATAELRTTVLGALPARTRRLVESEIDNSAEPSTREVQRAKAEITRIALEMVKGEEISLGR